MVKLILQPLDLSVQDEVIGEREQSVPLCSEVDIAATQIGVERESRIHRFAGCPFSCWWRDVLEVKKGTPKEVRGCVFAINAQKWVGGAHGRG